MNSIPATATTTTATTTLATPTATSNTDKTYYIVQKCWFDGPTNILDPPIDYLRLFETGQQAVQLAYESAHAFGNSCSNSGGGGANAVSPRPVRTLVLPAGAGYAFSVGGKLFWVRAVQAAVLVQQHNNTAHSAATSKMTAHAIVTHAVIGGTGNPNSCRRGSEASSGRIFIASDGASSGQAAVQAMSTSTQSSSTSQLQLDWQTQQASRVTWIPIGAAPAASALQEWPDRHIWVQQQQQHDTTLKQQRDDDGGSSWNVVANDAMAQPYQQHQQQPQHQQQQQQQHEGMIVAPAAKRHCRYSPSTVATTQTAAATAVTTTATGVTTAAAADTSGDVWMR